MLRSKLTRLVFFVASSLTLTLTAVADDAVARGVVYVDANSNRTLDAGEAGLGNVSVSNGRDVVQTDDNGRYQLTVDDDSIVFVIKPGGYRTVTDKDHLSRFYYIHKPAGSPKDLKFPGVEPTGPLPAQINFPLYRVEEPAAFDVIFFGDPQPRDQAEIDYIAHDVVEDLVGVDAAFGVTLGDILFDDLNLFDSLNRTIGKIGIPWYSVIGNHDINYAADTDELSDETYERVYGPAYFSFNYSSIHFICVDDVHWLKEGDKKLYRSGLSEKQLMFIENDLKQVPQDHLVVAMMHIPLVKSTPWIEPRREKLLRLLESREHCISLAGHTHHHEHVTMTDSDGWKGSKPHHHMINVTVCGAWWSGKPDEHGIPHTMCTDGTPNGYTVMHFDGTKYQLDYRAARRGADEQIRITAPEVVPVADAAAQDIRANVFNAFPDAVVEWRLNEDDWQPMQKTTNETDPVFQALFDEEQPLLPDSLPWRKLAKPMVCPHLWKATLATAKEKGTHLIQVRAANANGQVLKGERIIRVE
ncbi:MAG: calcineurin-like phosphoesterase C-terminal domain-containing protein [Planctomycetota bacterium]|nr:calcineurin-like phosphoesterase C-terminal domain-containing protein [Planctomycetota bacterium]